MPTPLHCPSAEEIVLIGRKLQVTLPPAYIEVLVHYPFPLDSDLARIILYANPKYIVARNEYYRKDGFFGHSWPDYYLIIGDFENGDLIFLDTTRENASVLVANHGLSSGAASLAVEDTGYVLPEWASAVLAAWQKKRRNQ